MSTRAIHDLPAVEWDGLRAPCSVVETSWENRLAQREYYAVPGASHDDTGRAPIEVTLTLHFHNTIEPDLYPSRWTKWRKALMSGEAKDIKHPDIGKFRARCKGGSYRIAAQEQSGVTVTCSFVESIKAADSPTKLVYSSSNAKAAAAAADQYISDLDLGYPDGMPEPSLEESINGLTGSVSLVGLELNGKVTALIGTVDRIKDNLRSQCELVQTAEAATRDAIAGVPERILLELQLDTLRWILTQTLENAAASARVVKSVVNSVDQSLASLSYELGADIIGMMDLNPGLLLKPLVPKGSKVAFYG